MSKHTPGPWSTDEKDHDQPYQDLRIMAGPHRRIALVWMDDAPVEDYNAEQRANAQLIAAAPDLLAALYLALPYVEVQDGDEHYKPGAVANTIKTMQAAIAKAEGR